MVKLKGDWNVYGVEEGVARLWIEHGGDHHGPRVETVTMPMSKLMGFVAAIRAAERQTSQK